MKFAEACLQAGLCVRPQTVEGTCDINSIRTNPNITEQGARITGIFRGPRGFGYSVSIFFASKVKYNIYLTLKNWGLVDWDACLRPWVGGKITSGARLFRHCSVYSGGFQ